MPLPAEGLTPDSSPEAVQEAISASIKQCMDEGGREQDQCIAMAHSMAREATGKALRPRGEGGKTTRRVGE